MKQMRVGAAILLAMMMLAGCGPGGQGAADTSGAALDSMDMAAVSSEAVTTSTAPERARTVTKLFDLVPEDLYDITLTDPEDPSVTYVVTAEQQMVLADDFGRLVQEYKKGRLPGSEEGGSGFQDPWPEGLAYPTEIDPHDLHFIDEGMKWYTAEDETGWRLPIGFTYDTGDYQLVLALGHSSDLPTEYTYWHLVDIRFIPLT